MKAAGTAVMKAASHKKLPNVEDIYPLSPMQQGMLFHSLYEPGSGVYLFQVALELEGWLDAKAFRRAWEALTQRHAVLRTGFLWENLDEMVQVVREKVELRWREDDWRMFNQVDRDAAWRQFLEEDRRQEFDLKRAPLFRLALMRVDEERYYFAYSIHHLLIDGWCQDIMIREVFQFYEAFRTGRELRLPAPGRYREYIGWLQKQDEQKIEAFWRQELQGFTNATRLGIDRERIEESVQGSQDQGEITILLGRDLTTRVETFARTLQLTLNTLVQGAWALLLSLYSGESDVVFGAAVSGRSAPVQGIHSMLGLFFNTLPVRVRISGSETVAGYLKALQNKQAITQDFEYSPLPKVQKWSEVPRGKSLFEYMIVFANYGRNTSVVEQRDSSIKVGILSVLETNNYPLTLTVSPGEDISFRYNFSLRSFDAGSMERMLRHFSALLAGMVKISERRLSELSMLTDGEWEQVVKNWNRTQQWYGAGLCFHQLFEEQVKKTPKEIALVFGKEQLTYRELDEQANQLGHYLRRMGVGPEMRVGICVERSLGMVVALLGVLKAGGAYLPLDPGYPAERMRYMVEDSQASAVVTQEKWVEKLQPTRAQMVCVDRDAERIGRESKERVEVEIEEENLAYIYYTSGSTGRPKGVAMAHSGIVNYMRWGVEGYEAAGGNGAAVHSSIAVDLTLTNFLPLFTGRKMVLASETPGVEGLVELMQAKPEWSLLKVTPTHLTLLNSRLTPEEMQHSTKVLVIGADNLVAEPTLIWREQAPGVKLLNEYGPTETVVGCSIYRIGEGAPRQGGMPIGKPIANITMYVLDRQGGPLPVGLPGELYIGGIGVARGYWGRPDLTAERFVPDPFAGMAGARFYRTGDRARFLADGNIEFLGRVDHQVKIRGYRIEPEEVEAVLSGHPKVQKAMVVVREDEPGEKRLVGYIGAGREWEKLTVTELRGYVRERLPEYMVPSAFVVLEQLPVRASGKIDPKDLPAPERLRPAMERTYESPVGETETILARIWAEVLKLDKVGRHDNFFEMGGDSILSLQVIFRSNQAGLPCTAVQIFQHQTVAELAKAAAATLPIDTKEDPAIGRVPLTPIQHWPGKRSSVDFPMANLNDSQLDMVIAKTCPPGDPLSLEEIDDIYPLSPIQQGLFFHALQAPDSGAYFEQTTAVFDGELDVSAFKRAWLRLVECQPILRTGFVWEELREPVQVVRRRARLTIEQEDWRGLTWEQQQERLESLLQRDRLRGFQLSQAPLARVALMRLTETSHQFTLSYHHLLLDGWSVPLLFQDLFSLYEAGRKGKEPDHQSRRPYRDYIAWLEHRDTSKDEAYWREMLKGIKSPTRLRAKQASLAMSTRTARQSQSVRLSQAVTLGLQSLVRQHRFTLNTVMLAAWALVLSRYSDTDDMLCGVTVAGRPPSLPGVENMLGLFINTLPLRIRIDRRASMLSWCQQLQNLQVEWRQYESSPLVKVHGWSEIPRNQPLFESIFIFQNAPVDDSFLQETSSVVVRDLRFVKETGYPLVVFVDPGSETLLGMAYDTGRFEESYVVQMLDDFHALLKDLIREPEQELSCLLPRAGQAPGLLNQVASVPVASAEPYIRSGLTKHQFLIWLGQKLHPDAPIYNMCLSYKIPVAIDPEAFGRAFQALVDQSDALRTIFEEIDGVPQRRLLHSVPCGMEVLDFSSLADPAAGVQTRIKKALQRRLPMEQVLFDSALIKTAKNEFTWYLIQHHIICDAFSFKLIFDALSELYQLSLKQGLHHAKPLPPFQKYVDYEKNYRESAEYIEASSYWKQKLSTSIDPITFYGRTPLKVTTQVQRVSYALGQDLSRKLRVAAEKIAAPTVDVALFNVFASILCAWIYRVSQKREFRLGIASHNRQSPDFKKTIGFFMQVFPIEVRIEENDTFVSLANKIKAEVAQSMPYSRYTPENPVHAPHYDVLFNYHKEYTHQFQGVPVVYTMNHSGHGPESLAVQVRTGNHSDSFVLDCDFHCDVFTIEQREQALQHIQLVLDAFASNCDQNLGDLGLLTHAQRRQVLFEFNQTEVAFPRNQSLSRLFEIQAAKSAGKLAVECQGQSLSYSQLMARVNRLASRLRSLGVGPEVVVALSMQRGIDLLTTILAVFKAGGAYLPLDPSWPPQRFSLVLSQSRSPLLLVDTECQSRIVQTLGTAGPRVECVEDLLKQRLLRDSQFSPVAADHLAYVIYTSGSTGMPKGAMVEHGGMMNHLFAKIRDLQLTDKDVVAQTASQCFDISVWQFLAPLLVGGRVSIFDDTDVRDPARLLDRVRQSGITVLETVPSLLAAIMDNVVDPGAGISDLPALRWLVSTGEALQPRLAQRCLQAFPGISLCNAYGPTECSDDVSHYFMREPLSDHVTTVPIGRPIANTQLYILDDQFEPVLIGAAGELYAAGAGVGRGYLDDPARTAEVFVPNPFSRQPGARLYKTGDLARHDTSGTIEYLGRIDHQVKIRGFRIELGEIEARLMEHSQVQEAAVLAWEKTHGEKVLVAYYTIVARTGEQHSGQEQQGADSVGAEQLQAHLVAKLPEYSVPAAYVRLEKLPLTPNGKVDRKALPAPEGSSYPMQAYEPPVGETEAILTRIWAEVLKLDKVGRHDDFFQIGGDSILSIQVVSWSRRAGLHFTPTQLFEHPTIAKLAKAAVASLSIDTSQEPVIGKVPLTPIQQWFFEHNFPNPHRWNQSLLFEVDPSLSVSHLERALQHLVFHHDALRLRFELTATGWQQAIAAPGETVRLEHVDVSRLPKKKQEAAIESATATAQASLNLGEGPVLHATFFDFGAKKQARLLLIVHHLVIDGVSWRILVEDMQALCRQASRGEALRLPPKTSSFKQWAERLTEHAASEAIRKEARYWLENSSSTAPGLPVDHRGGINTEASIQTVSVSFSADETRVLLQDFPRVFHTRINDVLLTALAIAFRGWTGEPSLLVNMEGHGRESVFGDIDLSRTIGWFTDFFPVRLSLDLSVSDPAEALQAVSQQLRRVSNGGIGYGLARYLNSDPQTAGALRDLPQPEVVFNYLGQFDSLLGDDSLLIPFAENNGPDHGPEGHRSHLLEINAQIAGKQLTVNWGYSRNIHREETIANLAQRYGDALRALLKYCQSDQIRTELPKAFVPPRDDWELRLTRMWEEILEIQPIGVRDKFFDLGGNTRLAMRLRSQIHKVSGCELSLAILFERPTIEALAQVLRQQSPVAVSSLVLINPTGSKPPLFFVHAQGGGAVAYYDLAHRLGKDQPFYGLEPPGRDGQREPLSGIPEMAAHYLESLRRIQPEGPYRLGGHSFGGLVAFEMATQLWKQGTEVAMLAILDTAAPVSGNTVFNPEGFIDEWDDAMVVVSLAKIVARVVRKDLEMSREELAGLDYEQRLIYFLEKLKKVDFVSPEEGPSLVRGLVAVERAMAKARRNYLPQGRVYPGLMTLFLSADIAPEDFRARDRKLRDDPVLGWGELVSGAIETHIVPGDHISMLNQPHVQILAQKLASCLDQASWYSPRKESQSA